MNITQRTVDQIVARAQNSAMGLGDPDKGRCSYDLKQYAEPHGAQELAMLFVSAHFAKWDIISLMTAALEVVVEGETSSDSEPGHSPNKSRSETAP